MPKKKPVSNTTSSSRSRTKKVVLPQVDATGNVATPISIPDSDPGDETQRRFRYQHAYGVILLSGMANKSLPYEALWCEHHDDFLAQNNGTFDSYQIKTRTPELGAWELTTEGFVAAIAKFVLLETQFPGKISKFHFVSNTRTSDSQAEQKAGRSPNRLQAAIVSADCALDLVAPFDTSLAHLAD